VVQRNALFNPNNASRRVHDSHMGCQESHDGISSTCGGQRCVANVVKIPKVERSDNFKDVKMNQVTEREMPMGSIVFRSQSVCEDDELQNRESRHSLASRNTMMASEWMGPWPPGVENQQAHVHVLDLFLNHIQGNERRFQMDVRRRRQELDKNGEDLLQEANEELTIQGHIAVEGASASEERHVADPAAKNTSPPKKAVMSTATTSTWIGSSSSHTPEKHNGKCQLPVMP